MTKDRMFEHKMVSKHMMLSWGTCGLDRSMYYVQKKHIKYTYLIEHIHTKIFVL